MTPSACVDNASRLAIVAQAAALLGGSTTPLPSGPKLGALPNVWPQLVEQLGSLVAIAPSGTALPQLALTAQSMRLNADLSSVLRVADGQRLDSPTLLSRIGQCCASVDAALKQSSSPDLPDLPNLLPRIQLAHAAAALRSHGIDLFTPSSALNLKEYVRKLLDSGTAATIQAPGISIPAAGALRRISTLLDSLNLPPRIARQVGVAVPHVTANLRLPDLSNSVGSLAWLQQLPARALIPEAGQLLQLSTLITQKRLGNLSAQLAPVSQARSKQPPFDILAALEAGGCCQVLAGFTQLKHCADGAARLEAATRAVAAVKSRLGIDMLRPGAVGALRPVAQQLGAEVQRSVKAKGSEADSKDIELISRAAMYFNLVRQAQELGLLVVKH